MLKDRPLLVRSAGFAQVPARRGSRRRLPPIINSSPIEARDKEDYSMLPGQRAPETEGSSPDPSSPGAGAQKRFIVRKRGVVPLMRALGGSIPIAPVFVPAEQIRTLLSQRHEVEKRRRNIFLETAVYLKAAGD